MPAFNRGFKIIANKPGAQWAETMKKIKAAALERAVQRVTIDMDHAVQTVLSEGVPSFMSPAAPLPNPKIDSDYPAKIQHKPAYHKQKHGSDVRGSAESGTLAQIAATLVAATGSNAHAATLPVPNALKNLYHELGRARRYTSASGMTCVGCFNLAALDAATQYQAKLVLFPGPYDEEKKKTKWMWWVGDHWEADAWVLNADGSAQQVTQHTHNLFPDWEYPSRPVSQWRAPAAMRHGYWADVEYGANISQTRLGRTPTPFVTHHQHAEGQSLMAYVVATHGAQGAVVEGAQVTNNSRTFLVGNRPYLILTRIAARLYQNVRHNERLAKEAEEFGPAAATQHIGGPVGTNAHGLRSQYEDSFLD